MTDTQLPDAQARHTIRHDLGRTLFVDAGAGSGKTRALVDRITELVLTDDESKRTPLSAIAAITFTEAAAAELRARIRARFEEAQLHAEHSGDRARAARCAQALQDTDIAAISTLHSFAHRMLAEFPMDVSIPPRVEVLDEVQSQLAFDDRWSAFVDMLFADERVAEFIVRATILNLRLTGRHSQLRMLARIFDDNWDRLLELPELDPDPTPIPWHRLEEPIRSIRDALTWCVDPTDKLLVQLQNEHLRVFDSFEGAVTDIDRLRVLIDIAALGRVGNKGTRANWDGRVDDARGLVAELLRVAEVMRNDVANQTLELFAARIARFTVTAADERRADGRLEFHDLLVLARTLLRTAPAARASLADRYRIVMLDEFQDTDPIQIELALLLTSTVDGVFTGSWSELRPEEGRLFMVGDPKQSIYRFRRADISLFLDVADRFGAGRTVLTQNFRTVEPIIGAINAFFDGRLMRDADEPLEFSPLTADRSPSGCDHRPLVLAHEADLPAGALRVAEAELVAGAVRAIIDQPDAWLVAEERATGSGWRRPRLADITVLVPTRLSVPQLTAALDTAGIPYRADTGSLVYETQAVRELLAVLRAVDDPSDQVSLVAALRSPLYGCTDPDLWAFRRRGGEWDMRRHIPDEASETRVARSIEHLRALAERRWWEEPSALLGAVLDERDAFAIAAHGAQARDTWRRLRYVQDQARAFAEANGGDLRAYLRWAALQGLDGSKAHEPMLEEPDLDAVRIMTIHGSKGLEFPITVVSGLTTQAAGAQRGVRVSWNDPGELPDVRVSKALQSEGFDRSSELEELMDAHEKMRLLYVGLTRARDHLIVSGVSKIDAQGRPKASHGRVLFDFATGDGAGLVRVPDPQGRLFDGERPPMVPLEPTPETGVIDRYDDAWWEGRRRIRELASASRIRSATALAAAARNEPTTTDDTPPHGDPEPDDPVPPQSFRRGRAGTAIGSAVHGVLQYLDLAAPDDDSIARLAESQAWAESVPDEVDTIVEAVRSAVAAPVVARCRSDRHWKEVYVAAPIGEVTIEGYVDLLVEGPDGLTIVDYKTDAVRTEADIEAKLHTYRLQGAAYAAAIESATGLSVVDVVFVFTKASGAVSRSVGDVREAIGEVVAHARLLPGSNAAPSQPPV